MLKQLIDNGISKYMHKIGLGYTNYFNFRNKRCGHLFQGRFKAKHIDSEEYLFSLSAYINGNPEIHGYINKAEDYDWSSYRGYLGLKTENLCNKEIIMSKISRDDYKKNVERIIQLRRESDSLPQP